MPGFLIRAADGSTARYVGNRPAYARFAGKQLIICGSKPTTGIFFAGKFLKQTQPGGAISITGL